MIKRISNPNNLQTSIPEEIDACRDYIARYFEFPFRAVPKIDEIDGTATFYCSSEDVKLRLEAVCFGLYLGGKGE